MSFSSSSVLTTAEHLFKTPRSQKRSVSTGGGSDSRVFFSTSNLNTKIIASNSNAQANRGRDIKNEKSLSLSFNFTPPHPGSISFTSTAGGKWWSPKLGLKKLVKSVRSKRKNSKCPPKPTSESELTQHSITQSSLDLKKRKVDNDDIVVDSSSDLKLVSQKKYRDQILQTLVGMTDMNDFYKPDSFTQEAALDTNASSNAGPAVAHTEACQSQENKIANHETSINLNKTFRTPRQSFSDINTESDASFVICDAYDDANEISASAETFGAGTETGTKDEHGRALGCRAKNLLTQKLPTVNEGGEIQEISPNQSEEALSNCLAGGASTLEFKKGSGDSGNSKATTKTKLIPVPVPVPVKAPRKKLTITEGDNVNVDVCDSDCVLVGDVKTKSDSDRSGTGSEADIGNSRNSPTPTFASLKDYEENLIQNAIQDDDESELAAKLASLMTEEEGLFNGPNANLNLNPADRRRFRIPPFLVAAVIALILQYTVLPFIKRFLNPESPD